MIWTPTQPLLPCGTVLFIYHSYKSHDLDLHWVDLVMTRLPLDIKGNVNIML